MESKLPSVTVLVVIFSAAGVTHAKVSTTSTPTASKWTTPEAKGTTGWPTRSTGWPTGWPTRSTGWPTGWPTRSTGWPTRSTGWPTRSTGWPTRSTERTTGWTTGRPVQNLNGKMFTLSLSGRGWISLHQPFLSPQPPRSRSPYTKYPPWTTSQPYRGVSVCLRYVTDFLQTKSFTIFTLSPSSSPLTLGVNYGSQYWLSCDRYTYRNLHLQPSVRISSPIRPEAWTAVCLTVDTRRNMAQMFSGSSMSIKKFLPNPYAWSGEGQIVFAGFDGQVTDVQVWDYPLRYPQVYNYMTGGAFMPYGGSVITWSHVAYSLGGKVQLEEAYKWQEKQLVSSRGRGGRQKKKKKVFNEEPKL